MSANLIKTLIPNLPRYAEEEGDFYSVSRDELINALCSQQSIDRAVAVTTIELLENLLDTLAVLNSDYLQKGEWCFVSFPAQLLAMSVLTAMSDKDSRFFADNFWNTQGIANDRKEQQRDILRSIENSRQQHHAHHNAPPIRYIYVAWSIIKLNNQILFYQREDTRKNFEKQQAGDYSLIGGRLNQRDIPCFTSDKKNCMQQLQSNSMAFVKDAIGKTLKRELYEEADLSFDTHYTFKLWRSLKPYTQVQGAAPNHALTEYYIDIFHVALTLEGYLFLQQKIKSDERLVWFSMADIERGKTLDGSKVAYINALFNDFGNDRATLKTELMTLPDSFDSGYLFTRNQYGLTLLQNTDKPLLAGASGKEKILDVILTERQQQILMGLAAHNRGFEFTSLIENVALHPHGWIELQGNTMLQKELNELAAVFRQQTEFVIENEQDCFFRLSVEPSLFYFDAQLFTYSVSQTDLASIGTKVPITISRATLSTALGVTTNKSESFNITLEFAKNLKKLHEKKHASDNEDAEDIQDNYRKSLAKNERFIALGLKGLLRRKDGVIEFCADYQQVN